MTQRQRAAWLPSALLLLWLPGCVTLSGPRVVSGPEGGSLSLQCRYEEQYKDNDKYWCRVPPVRPCDKSLKTSKAEREKHWGRVSIRDDPAHLNFIVTLTNLTAQERGLYWCGIFVTLLEDGKVFDPVFQVMVSVFSASTSSTPISTVSTVTPVTSTSTTSTTTPKSLPVPSTVPVTECTTHSGSSQEDLSQSLSIGLPVLLSVVIILLLLLTGTSLVAWRLAQRRWKAAENRAEPENPSQPQPAQPREPYYTNLELPRLPSGSAPTEQQDVEGEYSMVDLPREEVNYTSVIFPVQSPESEETSTPFKRPSKEPIYSVIKKT